MANCDVSCTGNFVLFVACAAIADVTFLIDTSGSITERDQGNWDLLKNFVKRVIARFNVGASATHIGAVQFSTYGSVQFYLDQYYSQAGLSAAVDAVTYVGQRTNIADALELARTQIYQASGSFSSATEVRGDRRNVVNIVILITDGIPNERESETLNQAQLLKSIATVVSVGITDAVDRTLLAQIASQSNLVLFIDDFAGLDSQLDQLLQLACPTQAPNPGTHSSACTVSSLAAALTRHLQSV